MFLILAIAAAIIPSTVISHRYCSPNGIKTPANNNDPAAYFECVKHKWDYRRCLNGYEFDVYSMQCEHIYRSPSPPPKICTIGETRPYLFDNTKYEICVDGYTWSVQSCQKNYVFSNGQCTPLSTTTRTTRYYTTTTTTPPPRPTTENEYCIESAGSDGFKPYPYDCTKYYRCVHGYWVQRPCPPGTAWDQHNLTCNFYDLVCKQSVPQPKPTSNPNGNSF